ncbi:MAG: squalene--hopene cyclase [Bdellovibrionales bacterium]|nr:squalene--hopene cyclase [Bdellovibrionales bacterium]
MIEKLTEAVRKQFSMSKSSEERIPPSRKFSAKKITENHTMSSSVASTLKNAKDHILSLQTEHGYWEGRVYDNVTITAEYIMMLRFLGILDSSTRQRALATILDMQMENGGWSIYHEGPVEHSATVEAYFALKLCGLQEDHPALLKAKKLILKQGGIETTRVFTKIHLALFGEYPWGKIPVISPELMLLPRKAPIHIYEFSSWSRAVIIPLLIIFHKKPVVKIPEHESISELETSFRPKKLPETSGPFEQAFELIQMVLSTYEKSPVKPFRSTALALAERWIIEHQDPSGNWGGIYPAMANSIVALHLRGYLLSDPIIQRGLEMLRTFAEDTPESFRMQSTVSPVWDTGIAVFALQEAGLPPSEPSMQKAVNWLLEKQILHVRGDWRFKARKIRPGGWPFEHENDHYPDIDDSALAILALLPHEKQGTSIKLTESIDRGIEWILGMQGNDGGWGAFDRDNNREILNQIPFADLKSLLDPSTPDVTGHVLEALGVAGFDLSSKPIQSALKFVMKSQKKDGSWFGRWGVNYIYGTSAILSGLAAIGENMNKAYVQKSIKWLLSVQNSDGGFGESCASYDENKFVKMHSTASQTAWALIGLLACPSVDPLHPAIKEGVRFLVEGQTKEGGWIEPEWTGTGFPKHFYLRYDYYRLYFPLLALGRFAARTAPTSAKTSSSN